MISNPRIILGMVMLVVMLFGSGCGQVVTRPTTTPAPKVITPSSTPTSTTQPTPTPAPYTPQPTPTPTVSPTPVIHTIQSGETLISIAQQYGVNVATIQEVNGIANPRLLRVNQQIIIPANEGDQLGLDTPTVEPSPLPLLISTPYFGTDPSGGLWVMGEVTNPGSEPVENIKVRVQLLGEGESELVSRDTLIPKDIVMPDESSPYGVFFSSPPGAFSRYQVDVLQAYPAQRDQYYVDLEVTNLSQETDRYYTFRLRGLVRNVGPEKANEVSLIVTLYDAMDRVIGFRRIPPENPEIEPGGEVPFIAEITPLGGPVVHYEIQAQGRRLPIATPQL